MTEEEIRKTKDELWDVEWRLTQADDEARYSSRLRQCPDYEYLIAALDDAKCSLEDIKDYLDNAQPEN